jgi:hypothetical protein
MFKSYLLIGVIAFSPPGPTAVACEDKHPPIVDTPVEAFNLDSASRRQMLSLELDPRGIGAVVPAGDEAKRWIDSEDKTGVWHYREWQWWKGHPWGESCRPRYHADVSLTARRGKSEAAILAYRIDGFDCRQVFMLPRVVEQIGSYWDIVTSVRNTTGHDVEEYGQFFACYTPLNRDRSFWFWDESNKLVLFASRGVKHLDGYIVNPKAYFLNEGAIPHCPRGGGKIVGRWHHPVMVSQASPAGWRSVILLEAQYTGSLAQGIHGGAMDYILFPGPEQSRLADGAEFRAHIRHVMLMSRELPTTERLEQLWSAFERSHATIHERAARL